MKEELLDRLKSLTIAAESNLHITRGYEFYYSSLFPLYDLVENINRLETLHHLDEVDGIIIQIYQAACESNYYELKPLVMRLWNLISGGIEFTYPYMRLNEVETDSLIYSRNSSVEGGYYADDETEILLGLSIEEDVSGSF